MPSNRIRSEQDIFEDLAQLCASPGYVHALAFLAFRDNYVRYADELTAQDMLPMFSKERLIRTELSTLLGLMIKQKVEYERPTAEVLQHYIDRTDILLHEIHQAMWADVTPEFTSAPKKGGPGFLNRPSILREVIFYSGESAYVSQYRDLAEQKYAKDGDWLKKNKGFAMGDARAVLSAVRELQVKKVHETLDSLLMASHDTWTLLPGFLFTAAEVASAASIELSAALKVLNAFAVGADGANAGFRTLYDFNVANSTPLLVTPSGEFVLFSPYSLAEAIYDSPFYWMVAEPQYRDAAMRNRGEFAEAFSADRFERVFGKRHVYRNLEIKNSKGETDGEIDVLVLFGDRAILVQAKSKRLTLEARRGNDRQIRDDFQKSVQDAYDQAASCAELLSSKVHGFSTRTHQKVIVPEKLEEIYVICAVSDNYPALNFQAKQFLKTRKISNVLPPLVTDVFTLDAMTEMLESPLRLLSFLNRRAQYDEKLLAHDELTILSYHLKKNLGIDETKFDVVWMTDDISAELDVAMSVRRDSVPGKRTPDGILTRLVGTAFERLIQEIEARPHPATISFGMVLLRLSEEAALRLSEGIERTLALVRRDGNHHDFGMGLSDADSGVIVHCNLDANPTAVARLRRHCALRKYVNNAATWHGICISPSDGKLRFGIELSYEWKFDAEMEARTQDMRALDARSNRQGSSARSKKIGRNDPCPCKFRA